MENARQTRKVALVAAAIVIVVSAALAALVLLRGSPEPGEPSLSPTVTSDGCAGVEGQSIDLDTQLVDASPLTCFVLDDDVSITIGAAALEPSETISLAVHDAQGGEVGAAQSEPDWDPELSLELAAGTYTINVSGTESDDVPAFLLYTATFVPQGSGQVDDEQNLDTDSVPLAAACGTDVPLLTTGEPIAFDPDDTSAKTSVTADAVYACVRVEEPVFAKFGLESADPSDVDSPDLTMAIFRVGDASDETTLVRTADDTIGFDPETSLDLETGTYMIAATAWIGTDTGAFDFYYDDQGELFRHGEATSIHAEVTPEVCDQTGLLSPGDTLTVEGERTYICLEVEEQQRLTLQAATLTDQDLVLEVLGFDEQPYRLAWADGNPYSDVLADFDPLLDQTIPAGTWIVAVTTYFTEPAADYDLRVVAGGGA